ncbi:hypothetical protein D9M73_143490 [compost metagenome]
MMHDCQRAAAELAAHQVVDRQALDLFVVDKVVVILGAQLGQARYFDQLLDLRGTGLLLGLFLLLAVEFLVALDLFGHGFLGGTLLGVVDFDLALVLQALLFLFLFTDLLDLLLVDQTGFQQLVT